MSAEILSKLRALAREQTRFLPGEVLRAFREEVKRNTPEQKREGKGS